MSNDTSTRDPDDFFAETRMSFGDHLEDLRGHLWRAIYGFLIAMVGSFFIGHIVLEWITNPVRAELRKFYDRHGRIVLEKLEKGEYGNVNQRTPYRRLNIPEDELRRVFEAFMQGKSPGDVTGGKRPVWAETIKDDKGENGSSWWGWLLGSQEKETRPLRDDERPISKQEVVTINVSEEEPLRNELYNQAANRLANAYDEMAVLSVMEGFMVWVKVCILCGLVIGSPWIFWQIWAFVAAGLYPHEKKLVHVYLPFSLGLFLAGVILCEVLVIPKAIGALLWFNEWLGLKPDLRLNEWLSFAILMPLVFGIAFQTPLVMMFLERIGVMTVESFRSYRRMAWFIMALFAMIFVPSPDAFSMLLMWVPMVLLFELGILLCRWSSRRSGLDVDVPQPDELVEV
jgi:sec-independent protein translocase protein TatC